MIPGVRIAFDPALPQAAIIALALLAALSWGVYAWRGGGAPSLWFLGLRMASAHARAHEPERLRAVDPARSS